MVRRPGSDPNQVVETEPRGHTLALASLSLFPILLTALATGAHFLRRGHAGAAVACALLPALFFLRQAWVPRAVSLAMAGACALWLHTAWDLAQIRRGEGAPFLRAALILTAVAFLAAAAAWLARARPLRRLCSRDADASMVGTAAFLLTLASLAVVQMKVPRPMLLAERFFPGAGWVEMLAIGAYAGFISGRLWDVRTHALWRKRIWLLFSAVFFGQLALGLMGQRVFLMTGALHPPVPAVILAGPLYRGGGPFFMPVLFVTTLLLVGPAWCSHLCYIGAWDNAMAARKKPPSPLPRWTRHLRWIILCGTLAVAAALGAAGASTTAAALAALGFGAAGVALMAWASRRSGAMVHCTVYCPAGLAANLLGKISPFRLTIGEGCTDCLACSKACRFDALNPADIARRAPALTCSLCGDCVRNCPTKVIEYRWLWLRGRSARALFTVLTVACHAVFLGVARI